MTADQILERLPPELFQGVKAPRQKLRAILGRREVGHASRGRYVYLLSRITGSTLRLPLTGREAEDGYLQCGPDLVYALWFRLSDGDHVPSGAAAACELPDGRQDRFTVEQMVRSRRHSFSWVPLVAAGAALRNWLREARVQAGDSLHVHIKDAAQPLCHVTLERLSERDAEVVARRNAALADAAERVLRDEVRGRNLSLHDLTGWLLTREFYHDEVAPDPLEVVLLHDLRFTQDDRGHCGLATKWEWIRHRNLELPPGLLEALMAEAASAREPQMAPATTLSEAQRRALVGVDPIEELRPWLEAAGYTDEAAGEEGEETAQAEELAARREQVYRLRCAFKHRPSVQRVLEARGDNTLIELDHAIRSAFDHDTFDHMSQFYVRTGTGRKAEGLGSINPFGEIEEGEDMELAELDLEPGDTLSYVYDFGDWIEHTVTVEAVLSPERGKSYPRVTSRTGRTRRRD